ncbi:hypothetical protein A9Q81_02330 [Gammaproteobacteria bacterium 42_54_T18]|nr:hypothetical protein A9Q81_02330 [Gammaproteobacteria bacterium 42_54_T18]
MILNGSVKKAPTRGFFYALIQVGKINYYQLHQNHAQSKPQSHYYSQKREINFMDRASSISTSLLVVFIVFLAQLMLANTANSTTVYKNYDANGNLVFSDEPFEGAEAIDVKPIPTINLHLPKNIPTSSTTTAPVTTDTYQSLDITSPVADSSIVNTAGAGTVNVTSSPGLQSDHQYKLLINGENQGTQSSNSFAITGLFRGAHTAVAQIVKGSGEVIKVSAPVTFFVRQHSIRH